MRLFEGYEMLGWNCGQTKDIQVAVCKTLKFMVVMGGILAPAGNPSNHAGSKSSLTSRVG